MRTVSLLAVAAFAVSSFAIGADKKNESLDTFHSISMKAIKECQDKNYSSRRKIEEAIDLSILKMRGQYDLMSQARRYGMPDKVKSIQAEIDTDNAAFISKRDEMLKELAESADVCAQNGVTKVKTAFPKANDSVKKKAALSKLLKDYFANVLTVINGSVPAANEKSADYKIRQAEATTKVNDLWNRFDVEVSY